MNRRIPSTCGEACNAPERRCKQVPAMALIINTTNLPNNRKNEAITSFLLFNRVLYLLLLKFPVRLLTMLRRVPRGNAETRLALLAVRHR